MMQQDFLATGRGRGRVANVAHVDGGALSDATGWHRWKQIMPALRQARDQLDLNRGRLDLLEKLMACLPADRLALTPQGELIVHVSNARLAEMMNRDSDKSITRLITEVEARGLLRRKSSPNGKRYARRRPDGTTIAYGLDLAPLLMRMPEIIGLAAATRQEEDARRQLREECSLALNQLGEGQGAAMLANDLHDTRKMLRRKLPLAHLRSLLHRLRALIADHVDRYRNRSGQSVETTNSGGTAPQNGCHIDSTQNHLEPAPDPALNHQRQRPAPLTPEFIETHMPKVTRLGRALDGSLRDLVERMLLLLGIRPHLWRGAIDKFGFEESALLCMILYEHQQRIRNPSAYLQRIISDENASSSPGSRLVRSAFLRTSPA